MPGLALWHWLLPEELWCLEGGTSEAWFRRINKPPKPLAIINPGGFINPTGGRGEGGVINPKFWLQGHESPSI